MAALVELQHDGMPGDIITTGFVLNLKEGYSSSFSMSDPAVMRSNNLSGAHFRFGGPDPGEEFPKGTNFRAPLFVANVGTQSVRTHVTVDYTPLPGDRSEAQQGAVVTVKDLTIAPGQVQRVELTDELARLGVKGPVAEDGVDITYDGAPGSIIAELTSVDQSGNYSFEVPIKDPSAMNVMDEGVYPWTLEGGTNTVVHLKNSTNEHAQAIVLFSFAGGSYNLEPVDLAPYQTMAIDIQKLKDLKKPDVRKQVFPEDATHGQVAWLQRTPYSMIGRAESVNLKEGIASSFSCGAQCCTANLWEEDFCESLDGSSCSSAISGDVGDSGTLVGLEYGHFCNGSPWGPNTQTPNSWSSDNTSVATVSSGTVTLVGAGTANISADFTQLQYAYGEDGYCGGVWYDYPGPAVAAKSCDFTITPSTGNLTPAYCDALTLNTTTFSATISGGCTVVPSNSSCTYSYSGTASVDGSSYADINQTYNYANCVMKYYAGTGTGTIQLDMNLKFYEAPHVLTHTSIQGISCP
jgi:hypothetical protein